MTKLHRGKAMIIEKANITKTRSSKLLVSIFGVFFENSIYSMADKYLENYNGGSWSFAKTENGIPFMIPKGKDIIKVTNPNNHFSDEMSAEAAGYILTVMAVSNLMWKNQENKALVKNFQLMIDSIPKIFSKEESLKIENFLD